MFKEKVCYYIYVQLFLLAHIKIKLLMNISVQFCVTIVQFFRAGSCQVVSIITSYHIN